MKRCRNSILADPCLSEADAYGYCIDCLDALPEDDDGVKLVPLSVWLEYHSLRQGEEA